MKHSRVRYPNRRERRLAMHTSSPQRIMRYWYEYKIAKMVPRLIVDMYMDGVGCKLINWEGK